MASSRFVSELPAPTVLEGHTDVFDCAVSGRIGHQQLVHSCGLKVAGSLLLLTSLKLVGMIVPRA